MLTREANVRQAGGRIILPPYFFGDACNGSIFISWHQYSTSEYQECSESVFSRFSRGGRIFPQSTFTEDAGKAFPPFFYSCLHFPSTVPFWGNWQCILELEHEMAAFFHQRILFGILAMLSHVSLTRLWKHFYYKIMLLGVLKTQSQVCTRLGYIFHKCDYFVDVEKAFSCFNSH